ncbi:MAG TPA: thermonuclease family protein [Stellaceae bacterium]|nr:thermonuclease family protein [Stellaceae bacterium]
MVRRIVLGAAGLVLLLAVAWAALLWLRPTDNADRYAVVDGDTLALWPQHCLLSRVGIGCLSERLRLYGVDAFESTQTCRDAKSTLWRCGAVATERLRQLVAQPDFACHVDPEFVDRHAREFAVCTSGGRDVGALLVNEGLAFAYGRGAQYLAIESEAKARARGAWAGSFVRPQFFRQGATE